IRPESLPLRGDFDLDVNLSGTLREANQVAPRPRDGYLRVNTGALTWRGRPLGTLRAELTASDGLLVAREFQLIRAPENGPERAVIQVTGRLPLSGDEPGLQAKVALNEAAVDFAF